MTETTEFLPEDIYNFLGHNIGIRSNSFDVLAHLRWAYGRFYVGSDKSISNPQDGWRESPRHVTQVIDNLASSNEIVLHDKFNSYRLRCKSLYDFDYDYYSFWWHVPDPMTLIQWVVLRNVSLLARDYHIVHAGAVSWKNEGMIFPANANAGKTTLVLKLVMHGCKFLSDELACLNADSNVIEPFPRRVSVRHHSQELLGLSLQPEAIDNSIRTDEWEGLFDIEDIAPDSLSNPCTPRYILFLRAFGEKPRLEYISSSNALFELFKFSISPIDDPALLLFKFAPLLNKVECFNLVMGDLDETTNLVMKVIDRRQRHHG